MRRLEKHEVYEVYKNQLEKQGIEVKGMEEYDRWKMVGEIKAFQTEMGTMRIFQPDSYEIDQDSYKYARINNDKNQKKEVMNHQQNRQISQH